MIRRVIKRIFRKIISTEAQGPVQDSVEDQPDEVGYEVDSESEEELNIEVNSEHLDRWLIEGRLFQIIDIREPYELQNGFLLNAWNIPMNSIPDELQGFPNDRTLVIVCAAGVRSFQVTHYLREQGLEDVWSLDGGIADWADKGFIFPKRGKFSVGNRVTVAPYVIADRGVQKAYGRVQNVQEASDEIVYQIGVWTIEGYQVLDDISEEQLDYYQG